MKSVYENRRENLRAIIVERYRGKQKAFAELMGWDNPSLVSRHLSVKPGTAKPIGYKVARKIEDRLQLPEMWLDAEHQPSPDDPDHLTYDRARYARLPGPVREEISWYIAQKIQAYEGRAQPASAPSRPATKAKNPPQRKKGAAQK